MGFCLWIMSIVEGETEPDKEPCWQKSLTSLQSKRGIPLLLLHCSCVLFEDTTQLNQKCRCPYTHHPAYEPLARVTLVL